MARYDYRCPSCEDRFEVERSMSDPGGPVTCPSGHEGARRVFTAVTTLGRAGAAPPPTPVGGGGGGGGGGCCGGACGCG